ncbi:MAG: DUF177 domain-containing protein [Lachnospiraceae bacterium]|jgi:uncharacterized protein|nr:DUF177 domain-containing protein [Lachnospiraceae bacterium]
MLLNLTDIFTSEQKTVEKQVDYEPDSYIRSGETYEITCKEPVVFRLANTGKGKAVISGHMDLTLSMVCDRCLKPVPVPLSFDFEEHISEDMLNDPDDADEFFYMEGYKLDTEKLLGNEILINWPPKVLCKEDCKGICKKCGKDLNLGDCGCDDFVPDPRMAVIKDIFNAG